MKKIFHLICLTVMLRVWWSSAVLGPDAGTGIVVGSFGQYSGHLIVRKDDGELIHILYTNVYKNKFVEVKAEND